jgi:YD repeat-containing protein
MDDLVADRHFNYDTLDRLVTARVTDTQNWTAASEATTWYQYDDLGNRQSHSYRDAGAIAYGHDQANRMTACAGNTQNYDAAGLGRRMNDPEGVADCSHGWSVAEPMVGIVIRMSRLDGAEEAILPADKPPVAALADSQAASHPPAPPLPRALVRSTH